MATSMKRHDQQHPDDDEAEERKFQLIQKVVELLKEELPSFASNQYPPPDSVLDLLFERANLLLRTSEKYLYPRVHAYQLFLPNGPLMSARTVAERFHEIGWKGMSHNTLRSIVERLLSLVEHEVQRREALWEQHFNAVHRQDGPITRFRRTLHMEVQRIVEALSMAKFFDDVSPVEERIEYFILNLFNERLKEWPHQDRLSEDPAALIGASKFMRFVCGANDMKQFKAGESHLFRPYELFLFANQMDLMSENLTTQLHWKYLSEVGRLAPSHVSIMETYGDA